MSDTCKNINENQAVNFLNAGFVCIGSKNDVEIMCVHEQKQPDVLFPWGKDKLRWSELKQRTNVLHRKLIARFSVYKPCGDKLQAQDSKTDWKGRVQEALGGKEEQTHLCVYILPFIFFQLEVMWRNQFEWFYWLYIMSGKSNTSVSSFFALSFSFLWGLDYVKVSSKEINQPALTVQPQPPVC